MVAVCDVNPLDEAVMVRVSVPCGVPPEPPQPERATKMSKAPAIAKRVRSRCSEANRSMIIKMSAMGATILMEPGGKRGDVAGGGASMAVVAKVSIAVAVAPAVGVTDDGEIVQVDFRGAPVQPRATAALKLPTEVMVMVAVPIAPLATVSVVGETAKVKLGATACMLPVSATVCTPPPSVMVSVAVSVPVVEGV